MAVEDIDLSDMAFWGRPPADREAAFTLLRAERPIAFFEEPDLGETSALALPRGPGYRVLTRHADVTEVSRHPDVYCSGKGALTIIDLPEEMIDFFAGMISTDNPRHARLRRIVSAAFSPRHIRAIEESIEQVAVRLIDQSAGLGECDLVTSFAAPLSLEIICNMMGLPPSEHATVFRCSNVISSSSDVEYLPEGSDTLQAILEAGQELTALMTDLASYRLTHPTDDLTTALVSTNIDGEALSQSELASFFILLLTAGNETTRNSISHGILP
jgi:cytochrome P450